MYTNWCYFVCSSLEMVSVNCQACLVHGCYVIVKVSTTETVTVFVSSYIWFLLIARLLLGRDVYCMKKAKVSSIEDHDVRYFDSFFAYSLWSF